MKQFILLISLITICLFANAQNIINGKVVDVDENELIGANVYFTGTTLGTTTDLDGNFTLKAASFPTSLTV